MTETLAIRVRPATRDDADAITCIYNEGIRGRGATFETRQWPRPVRFTSYIA